jgi:hypothetical protein
MPLKTLLTMLSVICSLTASCVLVANSTASFTSLAVVATFFKSFKNHNYSFV